MDAFIDYAWPIDESCEECRASGNALVGATLAAAVCLLGVFDLARPFLSPDLFSTEGLFLTVIGLVDCIYWMSLISRLSDPVNSLMSDCFFNSV